MAARAGATAENVGTSAGRRVFARTDARSRDGEAADRWGGRRADRLVLGRALDGGGGVATDEAFRGAVVPPLPVAPVLAQVVAPGRRDSDAERTPVSGRAPRAGDGGGVTADRRSRLEQRWPPLE